MLRRAKKVGRKFLNPVPTTIGGFGTILRVLPRFLSNKAEKFPRKPLGPFRTDVSAYAKAPDSGLRVTWMGHSSMLVEIDGVRVLVDPVWRRRARLPGRLRLAAMAHPREQCWAGIGQLPGAAESRQPGSGAGPPGGRILAGWHHCGW